MYVLVYVHIVHMYAIQYLSDLLISKYIFFICANMNNEYFCFTNQNAYFNILQYLFVLQMYIYRCMILLHVRIDECRFVSHIGIKQGTCSFVKKL